MKKDSEDEFLEFVMGVSDRLLRTAYLLCADTHGAEDLVQSAYTRLYPVWSRVARMDDPYAYVRRVLVNIHLKQQRRLKVIFTGDSPESAVNDVDPAARVDVMRALTRLPPRQRAVIVLRYWEGLSEREIANQMEITEGTVKSQASKALATLRLHGHLRPDSARETR